MKIHVPSMLHVAKGLKTINKYRKGLETCHMCMYLLLHVYVLCISNNYLIFKTTEPIF